MKLGEHAEFAAHVVGGFDFASERRTPKNHFARSKLQGIRKIRMAARILPNGQGSRFGWEMIAQEGFELCEVELFSRANGGRLILEGRHVSLARSPLSIRQQCRIIQVLERVECAERKTIPGEHKFAVRAV